MQRGKCWDLPVYPQSIRNEELRNREQQMRALTARLNAVREEERTRISREVHDELGQLLTGIKMDLRWMGRRLATPGQGDAGPLMGRLTQAEQLVDSTIESVQRIALELRPSALDTLGLGPALRDEARRFESHCGVRATVVVDAELRIDAVLATGLFRIFQELLTNVARHAQASSVRIELFEDAADLVLRVEDNGIGIGDASQLRAGGLGLVGVQERASEFGGTFEIEGRLGAGTVATVRVASQLS
jgi:two-component system sensor histidine kinase UhpB